MDGNRQAAPDAISDNDLVRQALAGDDEAFHALVTRYEKKVYTIAYSVVHGRDDALDITQEVFIKVHRKLRSFRGTSSFYTWLYRITLNLAIDYQRKRKHVVTVDYDETILDDEAREEHADKSVRYSPSSILQREELNEAIMKAIRSLPGEQRTALTLRELEGLSYEEIAKVCRCSIGTVMSRLHYGRKKLQNILRPYLA